MSSTGENLHDGKEGGGEWVLAGVCLCMHMLVHAVAPLWHAFAQEAREKRPCMPSRTGTDNSRKLSCHCFEALSGIDVQIWNAVSGQFLVGERLALGARWLCSVSS